LKHWGKLLFVLALRQQVKAARNNCVGKVESQHFFSLEALTIRGVLSHDLVCSIWNHMNISYGWLWVYFHTKNSYVQPHEKNSSISWHVWHVRFFSLFFL
jgi:hypothetical protein